MKAAHEWNRQSKVRKFGNIAFIPRPLDKEPPKAYFRASEVSSILNKGKCSVRWMMPGKQPNMS
jgi:hypothetical protein